MKKLVVLGAALFVFALLGYSFNAAADEAAASAAPKARTMVGYVIDTKCATANSATLGDFVTTHTKDCAVACKDSGYNLFSEGILYKFDKASSDKVLDFLGKADSKLNVKAEVTMGEGDVLTLISIVNAP